MIRRLFIQSGKLCIERDGMILCGNYLQPGNIRLTNQERELTFALLLSPGPLRTHELISHIWPHPDSEPEYPEAVIYLLMRRLRACWPSASITTHWGRGYELEAA